MPNYIRAKEICNGDYLIAFSKKTMIDLEYSAFYKITGAFFNET